MNEQQTIYLSGPMTGIPQFNFPAFDAAAARLRALGFHVLSPAELDNEEERAAALASATGNLHAYESETHVRWGELLGRDVELIADECDGIALLPGWEESRGARTEAFVAVTCGLDLYAYEDELNPLRQLTPNQVATATLERYIDSSGLSFSASDPSPLDLSAIEALKGEIRVTNETTGGEKGTKAQRMGLLPWPQLAEVSEHYAAGAAKYADHNWMKGYDWHLSYDAMLRHAVAWWGRREELDEETGTSHLSAIVFHALALMYFRDNYPEGDDRPPRNAEEAQS